MQVFFKHVRTEAHALAHSFTIALTHTEHYLGCVLLLFQAECENVFPNVCLPGVGGY